MITIKAIVKGIKSINEKSFKNLWMIAHPGKANEWKEAWESFEKMKDYKSREMWLAQNKTLLHYVEAYCVAFDN